MKRKLILFTQDFPFEKGEPFLEAELPYLQNVFDEILIIATALHKGYKQTRSIGANVAIYPVEQPEGRNKLIWGVYNGLLNIDFRAIKELKRYRNPKKKAAVLYYDGKYKSVLKKSLEPIISFIGDGLSNTKVVFYSYWFIETARAATALAKIMRSRGVACTVCTRAHGFDLYCERNPAQIFPFREEVFKDIDRVYPCSQNGTKYLKAQYPEYEKKIMCKYLGTEDKGVNFPNKIREFTLVSCSNLVPVKRLTILAAALQKLDLEHNDIHVTWICIGEGAEKNRLMQITNGFKRIKVQYLGALKNAEVLSWYQNNYVDLFINASSSEGLPVSIMEACSFGIPVIATDVGGTAEIIENRNNGILLPPDITVEELAEKIKEYYFLPQFKKESYRTAARKIWKEKFCAEHNYRNFSEELLDL